MTDIINISYTVNPKVANGRERFRNVHTGEEWWGNDPNEPELDFTPADPFEDMEAVVAPPPPMETLSDKAVKILTARLKPKAKVKK